MQSQEKTVHNDQHNIMDVTSGPNNNMYMLHDKQMQFLYYHIVSNTSSDWDWSEKQESINKEKWESNQLEK